MKIPWKSIVEILQCPMNGGGLGDVKTHPHPLLKIVINCAKLFIPMGMTIYLIM